MIRSTFYREAKKLVDEKRKKLDSAQITLSLLRSVCIVWSSSASEVLLAGSFDGWTNQVFFSSSMTFCYLKSLLIVLLLDILFWQIVFVQFFSFCTYFHYSIPLLNNYVSQSIVNFTCITQLFSSFACITLDLSLLKSISGYGHLRIN